MKRWPRRKFDIIYADPPWWYSDCVSKAGSRSTNHYPSMKHADMLKLPVGRISEKNSLLFMWTTSPNLRFAISLGEAWGFEFRTVAFVWDKQLPVYGSYTMSQIEQCLVFKKKRGRIPRPIKHGIRQFLSARRTTHSRKPDEIRDRITRMFRTQSKIELFARRRVRGWSVWGDEV